MGKVTITYSKIKDAAKNAEKAAGYYNDFSNELSRRVYNQLNISYGSDSKGYISSARNTVYNKIKDLNSKSTKYSNLSKSLYQLETNVRNHETKAKKRVESIATNELGLKNRKWYQQVGDWIYGTICVDLLNSNPLTRGLGNLIKTGLDHLEYGFNKTLDWFKHGDGKYYLNITLAVLGDVAAIAGTIAAIALCAGATVVTGGAATPLLVAAIASGIGTVLTVVDSGFSIYNNIKALKISKKSDDPGRTRYYGNISGVNDAIEKYDMGGETANKVWKGIGIGYEVVHTTADITAFVAGTVGTAGLTESIAHDPITGQKTVKVTYDKSVVKSNLKNTFKESVGFKKTNGKWKFDAKYAFSKNSRKTGSSYAQQIAKKHATNHGIAKMTGKTLKGSERINNLKKSIKNAKRLETIKKVVSQPKKIKGKIDNIEKVVKSGDIYKNQVKTVMKIVSDEGPNIVSPIDTINQTVIPVIDQIIDVAS